MNDIQQVDLSVIEHKRDISIMRAFARLSCLDVRNHDNNDDDDC